MATARKYFEIPVGGRLDRFRVIQEIGRGGHGVVYRAEDLDLGRHVALKTIAAQPEGDRGAPDAGYEARLLARVSDPHVVAILDFVQHQDTAGLVLELVEGPTLRDLTRTGTASPANVLAIGLQLAQGLRALHRAGIVHGDLKPANLRLSGAGVLKILDLSAGRWISWSGTTDQSPRSAFGTIQYMSPEQLLGVSGDPRSDIWSAGVVLFELAAGRTPFDLAGDPTCLKHLLGADAGNLPDLGLDVPISLQRIIKRALSCDSHRRFQSAGDLLKALRSAAAIDCPSALSSSLEDFDARCDPMLAAGPCPTDTLTVAPGLLAHAR